MRIVIEDGSQSWVQDVPNDADLSVGRALTNTIIIEDTAASREHCIVERSPEDAEYWLKDLSSRNGTRLNGRFVSKAKLNPGDRIEIGSTVITFTGPGQEGEQRAEKLETDLRARRNSLRSTDSSDALLRDPLTNLASYPAVVLELRRLLKPIGGNKDDPSDTNVGTPVALIKLDVDYLGLLNDMFGMRAGDEIIRQTGMAIRAAVDEMPTSTPPMVGREGGGKFLVAIPGGGLDQARELAEMARLGVSQRPLEGALRGATLTLSAGIACAPGDARTWDSLMRRGEAALAEAKRCGRDRVMVVPVTHGEDEPRIQATALRDTRASGLWAASGLWDPKVARGTGVPEATSEDEHNPIAPLTLTRAGQSILGLVAQALGSDLELDPLLELILGIICETTDAKRGFILLRDVGGSSGFRLRSALNRDAPGAKYRESAISQGILREVEKTRSAILVADAMADERFKNRDSIMTENIRSVIASPVLWGQQVVGIIYLDNKTGAGHFGEEMRDLLLACSRLVAGPIRRQSLHQAKSDELARAKLALARTAESNILRQRRYGNIIGDSAAMTKLFKLLDRLTQSHHPVLIHGESGTGKELVASAVHYNGPRAQGPFIAENCAALSDSLLEAELFGHVKGAFTGADHDRIGLVEAAHGGTLFLDEIGEMSQQMQAKLLRVLQEGELRPVGAREIRKVDVRLICASHRDLNKMASEGTFREDLYYRIAVMTIDVPPLRERREDIPLLVDAFLSKGAEVEKRRPPDITREALQLLVHYDWPGNVRELENEIKKLLTLVPEKVLPENLSPKFLGDSGDRPQSALRKLAVTDGADAMLLMIERGKALAEVIEAFEREIIGRILETTGGNRSETARRLGLSRPGLLKKMKRYGIS